MRNIEKGERGFRNREGNRGMNCNGEKTTNPKIERGRSNLAPQLAESGS